MPHFVLHCFAESGNAYKVALLMEGGAEVGPDRCRFCNGQTRKAEWGEHADEMGEVPVLFYKGRRTR